MYKTCWSVPSSFPVMKCSLLIHIAFTDSLLEVSHTVLLNKNCPASVLALLVHIQWVKWGWSDALSYCPNAGECVFFKDFFHATLIQLLCVCNCVHKCAFPVVFASFIPSSYVQCLWNHYCFLRRGIALVAFKMCKIVQGQGRIRQMTSGCVPAILILLVMHSPGIFFFFSWAVGLISVSN